jgi:hypothetical protein
MCLYCNVCVRSEKDRRRHLWISDVTQDKLNAVPVSEARGLCQLMTSPHYTHTHTKPILQVGSNTAQSKIMHWQRCCTR